MSHAKTIDDLLEAFSQVMSPRDIAKSMIKGDIASTITATRIESGLSQKELADKIGKSQATISKWENGDTNFTIDLLVDIAADLDLDLSVKLEKPTKARMATLPAPSYKAVSSRVVNFPTYRSSHDEELEEM